MLIVSFVGLSNVNIGIGKAVAVHVKVTLVPSVAVTEACGLLKAGIAY